MKILIINSGELPIPPSDGGAVEGLIDIFVSNKYIQQKYDITIVSKYSEKALIESKKYNCHFEFINTEGFFYKFSKIVRFIINKISPVYLGNAYIQKVKSRLKNKKYDVIIVENSPLYGLVLKHKFSDHIVLHLHNDYLNKNSKFNKQVLAVYDEIFAISKYIKHRIESIEQTNKVKVLYNGVDLKQFKHTPKKIELLKKFNIKKTDFVYICSGRIVPEKGILELIKAFNNVSIQNEILLIVGSPNYGTNKSTTYMEQVLNEASKNKRIKFTGFISHSNIDDVYSIGDFGIIPSKCNEAFGLSAIEFLATGIPIIITNDGALPEIASKQSCIIIDKNNLEKNIEIVLKKVRTFNSEKIVSMKKNAIIHAKKFSKEIYCDNFDKYISKYKV